MSVTSLELKFGDGDYVFALPIPQLRELQRVCGAGIFTIYGRVLKGRFVLGGQIVADPAEGEAFLDDILETIRLGLIGGGKCLVGGQEAQVNTLRARQLVDTYCYPSAPLRESWSVAAAILAACIEGYEPPAPKAAPKKKAPAKPRAKKSTSTGSPTTAD